LRGSIVIKGNVDVAEPNIRTLKLAAPKDLKVFECSDERAFLPYERIERVSFGFPINPAQAGRCSPLPVSQSAAPF
jgi:hypothetical protein